MFGGCRLARGRASPGAHDFRVRIYTASWARFIITAVNTELSVCRPTFPRDREASIEARAAGSRGHRPAVPPAQPAMAPRESRRSTEIRSERKSLLSAVCPSSRCGPRRAVDAAPGSDHPVALCVAGARPSAGTGCVPRLPSALKPVLGGQKLLVLLLRRFQGDPVSKMARGSFAGIKSPAVTSFPFPGLKLSHEAPLFPDARWSSAAAPGACRRPPLQCATETVSASAARESPFLSSRRLFSVNCWAAAARRPVPARGDISASWAGSPGAASLRPGVDRGQRPGTELAGKRTRALRLRRSRRRTTGRTDGRRRASSRQDAAALSPEPGGRHA